MKVMYVIIIIAVAIFLIAILNKRRNSPHMRGSTEQDIIDALKDGNTIEAIKHYRFVHNVGLKEAKEAINKMQENS